MSAAFGAEIGSGVLLRVSVAPRLQCSRNSRVDGHVSAYGMPNTARNMACACGPPHEPHADLDPLRDALLGTGSVSTSGPVTYALSMGRDRRNSRWPQRGSSGKCAGANDAPLARRGRIDWREQSDLPASVFARLSRCSTGRTYPSATINHRHVSHFSDGRRAQRSLPGTGNFESCGSDCAP
jgi:hypothetical protein